MQPIAQPLLATVCQKRTFLTSGELINGEQVIIKALRVLNSESASHFLLNKFNCYA